MTAMFLYHWMLLTTLLEIMPEICGMPVANNADIHLNTLNSRDVPIVSSMRSHGEQSEDFLEVRNKRHIEYSNETPEIIVNETQSNETSFEDYEKQYLINLTLNLLKQFLHYDKYLKHLKGENSSVKHGSTTSSTPVSPDPPTPLPLSGDQTTPDVRVDINILREKLIELRGMNVNQLSSVFNSLHRAAEQGVEDPGITSLCCNIG